MSRLFYHTMQDNLGNLLFDVTGTMRLAGTGTLATIYGDEALTVIIPNPMTNHPSFGSFKCYVPAGTYDFYMAKAGYTFETLTGLQGLGTMATQNATGVAITGGDATLNLLTAEAVTANGSTAGDFISAFYTPINAAGGSNRRAINCAGTAMSRFNAPVGMQAEPSASAALYLAYAHNAQSALTLRTTDSDAGAFNTMAFLNLAGTLAGSINVTGAATAFNTTSDARLKHDVETLTGELDLVRALRPVSFKWLANDVPGVGFLAHEVAAHVPGVITGEADAVDEAGGIIPQMIDYSKLVPFLVGAIQSLAARVAVLEDALGV